MAAGGRPSSTMRAFQYSGYGGGGAALKYVQVPVPSLKKDEVLIKVEAASINPADWNLQRGLLRPFLPKFPFIPVTDISGEIVEVGSAVCELKVGDKVVSKLIFWKAGGLAEYVAASESVTVARPAGVSAADAAGLPIAGLTALQALKSIGTRFDGTGTGANVLITAASGGIGAYAVQLAKLGNHHVTATCGARNLELVGSLGAEEVLDYQTPEGSALKNSSGKKYDYIINTTNAGRWSVFKPNLSSRGRVVDIAPNFANFIASILTLFGRKKLSVVLLSLGKDDLRFLLELVKEGKLRTVVDSRHPFEKAAEAWEKSMSGHATGKVIVEM
ncbi:chloroplast envelope quinone oxidoreductase homolog [Phragmites australis]|uniref:chloroplast envelope quinone oxidoreductase homolog n=1 Tax=Phragmites australis TaxID=29695 RepID=UPI002D79D43A|nr:chloroplast envelope quinone oxidoreductase homolog [Phragmites australis]